MFRKRARLDDYRAAIYPTGSFMIEYSY